jgi:uncharacterized repeat protein (TIGR03806 family)
MQSMPSLPFCQGSRHLLSSCVINHVSLVVASLFIFAPATLGQLVRQPNSTLSFPSTLPAPGAYATENAFGALTFSLPICVRSLPGVTNRLFVVERNSGIQRVDLTTNTKSSFLNLSSFLTAQGTPLDVGGECGFLSFAFHPSYNQNGFLYVFYSVTVAGQRHQRIARFRATGTPGNFNASTAVDTTTHTPMITQRDEAGNHNGGDMHFGTDGYLYISVGDEGGSNDQFNNARFINKDFHSAILRLDVDLLPSNLAPNAHSQANSSSHPSAISAGTYRIPSSNPFIGATSHQGLAIAPNTVRTEMFASGLRNPWRFSIDPPTGRIFVADVGQESREEIHLVAAGNDLGWSYREGTIAFNNGPGGSTPPPGFNPTPPIHDYDRGSGNSVTGGFVYRGTRLTEIFGHYVFADYGSGRIWSLRQETSGAWTRSQLFQESGNSIVAFGPDPRNGDVLFCMIGAGQVRRLIRSFVGTPPPPTLSGTGAFSNLATLTPQTGIVAYEPNVSFWSDHALKTRWFSIPNVNDTMTWAQDANWTFPTGQVWIKHFEIEMDRGVPASRRRLETRFLVKNATGAYGITYKWRSDNSDADLVGAEGLSEVLPIVDTGNAAPQTWRYPSRTECMTCHTSAAGFALSMNTRQLNRDATFGSQTTNLLAALGQAGYFTSAVPQPHLLPALAPLSDTARSLEWRVRSYLDANCSQCHMPGGGGQGSWDARIELTTAATGIINGSVVNHGGNPAYRLIAPGDASHSMILTRMQAANGFNRMPPIGSNVLDQQAIAILNQWLTTDLLQRRSFAEWQIEHFGSTSAPEAQPNANPDGDSDPNEREFLTYQDPLATNLPWALSLTPSGADSIEISYPQLPNRSVIIESSTDLFNWSPWDVPGNAPDFPSTTAPKVLLGPIPAANEPAFFFRARLSEL